MIDQLFFSKKNKKYFATYGKCDKCGNDILKQAVQVSDWHKKIKYTSFQTLCLNCMSPKTIKADGIASEIKIIFITPIERIPSDAVPIFNNPPDLKDGKFSPFDINMLDSDKTFDNTKYAGRESFEGSQIGLSPKVAIENKDTLNIDPNKLLIEAKESKAIVPNFLEYRSD